MSLFTKLFARNEPSEEQRLLVSLERLSEALRPVNAHWAGVLAALRAEAAGELASGTPVRSRYQLARKIESLFGGMGSLNDIQLPEKCQRLHEELFSAVQGALRVYWRALGRQSHTGKVTPFPVGASVRLVPGAVRYFERDESPVVIQDTPAVTGQTWWRVVRYEGSDITNMPSYLVQHNDTFMTARHESLDLAKE
jgi:hypothetical protein